MDTYADASRKTLASILPFAVLATVAVALRFYARRLLRAGLAKDDWICVVALVFTLGCFTLSCLMIKFGSGKHVAAVPPADITRYLQCLFAYQLVYAHAILFIKTSVLTMYMRLFPVRTFKTAVWSVQTVVVAWYVAVVLVSIFSCSPIRGFWDKEMVPPAQCISLKKFFIGNAIPNILTDLIILALPVRKVWTLQLRTAQKLSVCFIFSLGLFVTASSAVRLAAQFRVDEPDTTWAMNDTVIWTSLEPSFGVICACLPAMRPLLRVFSSFFDKNFRGTSLNALDDLPSNAIDLEHGPKPRAPYGEMPLLTHASGMETGRVNAGRDILVDTRIEVESMPRSR